MSTPRLLTSLICQGIAIAALTSVGGCFAHAEPAYVEVEYVPPDIEVYPSYVYEGRRVYLVNGRWYYRNETRWVYFREEPPPLRERRIYVQRAPAPRREAPPRERVRAEPGAPPRSEQRKIPPPPRAAPRPVPRGDDRYRDRGHDNDHDNDRDRDRRREH